MEAQTVGRMTRSRARAIDATPMAAETSKTPSAKTTTARGRKQTKDVAPSPKKLFAKDDDVQNDTDVAVKADQQADQAAAAEPVQHETVETVPAAEEPAAEAQEAQPAEEEAQQAEPCDVQQAEEPAAAAEPQPIAASPLPAAAEADLVTFTPAPESAPSPALCHALAQLDTLPISPVMQEEEGQCEVEPEPATEEDEQAEDAMMSEDAPASPARPEPTVCDDEVPDAASPIPCAAAPASLKTPLTAGAQKKVSKVANPMTAPRPARPTSAIKPVGFGSSVPSGRLPAPAAHVSFTADTTTPTARKSAATATPKTATTATASAKRVSISTPSQPKSATTASRGPIVRTPFNHKGLPDEEEDVAPVPVEMEAAEEPQKLAAEGSMDAAMMLAASMPAEPADPLTALLDRIDTTSEMASEQQPRAEDTSMAVDSMETCSAPAAPPVAEPAPVSAGHSAKFEQAHSALKSLAEAEASAAMRASSGSASVPSFMAPTAATLNRVKSKVVASNDYDPRSLNQLRREIKEAERKKASKQAPVPAGVESDDDTQMEVTYNKDVEDELTSALDGMFIDPSKKVEPLKGLPLPQGRHIRFDEEGDALESPTSGKPQLRGLPMATGTHIRFD